MTNILSAIVSGPPGVWVSDEEYLAAGGVDLDSLPELKEGNVWAMRIYPGGRKELRQCPAGDCLNPVPAVAELKKGGYVQVRIRDAWAVLKGYGLL